MRSEARSEKSELGQARRKVILRVFFMLRLPRKLIPHEPPRRHEPGRPPGSLYLSLLTGSARAGSAARNLESLPRPSRFLRAWFPSRERACVTRAPKRIPLHEHSNQLPSRVMWRKGKWGGFEGGGGGDGGGRAEPSTAWKKRGGSKTIASIRRGKAQPAVSRGTQGPSKSGSALGLGALTPKAAKKKARKSPSCKAIGIARRAGSGQKLASPPPSVNLSESKQTIKEAA